MTEHKLEDLPDETQKKVKTIIETLSQASYVFDDIIIKEVMKDHPCNQQAFIGNIGRMILIYAEKHNHFDIRNRNAVMFSKAVANTVTEAPEIMPFI